VLYDII